MGDGEGCGIQGRREIMKNLSSLSNLCGHCQEWYDRVTGPDGKLMFGQPDLEGIMLRIDGCDVPGVDINICPKCALDALCGRKGFRRRGNICEVK